MFLQAVASGVAADCIPTWLAGTIGSALVTAIVYLVKRQNDMVARSEQRIDRLLDAVTYRGRHDESKATE